MMKSFGITAPLMVLCLLVVSASAQSTIFNAPSTDVIAEKKLLIEGDFIAHFDKFERGGFQTFGYRTVYGVTKRFEAGINFFYTRDGGQTGPKELQPNFKYKVYSKEKYGFAVSSGAQFSIPLNKAAGNRTTALLYSNVSKVVKPTGSTRLTGGYYTVVGADRDFGTKNGAIVGIEQPIKGRLSFTADWFSGKNRYGYSAAGVLFAINSRQYVQFGYNFGNSGRANNSFAAFYGFTY